MKTAIDYAIASCETMMRKFKAEELPPGPNKLHYHQGVFLSGMLNTYKVCGDRRYLEYVKAYIDHIVWDNGEIHEFDERELDDIQPGILFFDLYEDSREEKYITALHTLLDVLRKWPCNQYGGFWHKEHHPYQMWLDSLYMGSSLMAMYGKYFNELHFLDVAIKQARGKDECTELESKFGRENLAFITGTIMHEMYSMPKLMWLKKNMPEAVSTAKCILLMQDFIVYMLTGKRQIDYSLATRTAAYDIRNKRWIDEIYDFVGIDTNLMSKPVPSGTSAGMIKSEIAEELNISKNITIVSGCQDQIAALCGANVLKNGEAMDGIGTVECVPFIMDDIPRKLSIYEGGYSIVPHINGNYACYILSYAGGATLKWYRDRLDNTSYSDLDKAVSDIPTDLLIMPHFAGAATPYMDSSSKAAIIGLTFEHNKTDIYKALMEGTSYEILLNIRKIQEIGIELKSVTATGGGANSDVWLQIKADIFGIPVKSLDSTEIGAAGTAILAGRAVGVYDNDTKLVGNKKIFYPNPEKNLYYQMQYKKYSKIYNLVKEVLNNG